MTDGDVAILVQQPDKTYKELQRYGSFYAPHLGALSKDDVFFDRDAVSYRVIGKSFHSLDRTLNLLVKKIG
jgi:hypothetical protein